MAPLGRKLKIRYAYDAQPCRQNASRANFSVAIAGGSECALVEIDLNAESKLLIARLGGPIGMRR